MNYNLQYISTEYRAIMQDALSTNRCVNRNLSYAEYSNATVLPFLGWLKSFGCVIDSHKQIIPEPNHNQWLEDPSLYDMSHVDIVHKDVVYLGFMHTCFGHWFTDNIRKIWFLQNEKFMSMERSGKIALVYTIDTNKPLTESQLFFFDLLGINLRDATVVDKPMQFDKVIIPEDAFCDYEENGRQYTAEMAAFWNEIGREIDKSPKNCFFPEKIYFTRTNFSSGKDYGEQVIEDTFSKLGYTIISPEQLPLMCQLQLVRNCNYFAATEGSLTHFALFCKQNTNVIIISKVRAINTHQLCANEYANLNVTYVEAHRSTRADAIHPWWGPFYLCVTPYLEQYVGHRIIHLPDIIRPTYWIYTRKIWVRAYRWMMRKLNNLTKND